MSSFSTLGSSSSEISQAETPEGMAALDAFGRNRVSQPYTIYDSKLAIDSQPFFWSTIDSGGGSSVYVNGKSKYILSTNGASGARSFRQTKRYFNYGPGKGQSFIITGVLAPSGVAENCVRRIGAFDDDNGVFFEVDNDIVSVVIRSKVTGVVVEDRVPQSAWNINKAPDLDVTKAQIFSIDLQWLGVGGVRFGFDFGDGYTIYVHKFKHANIVTDVYLQNPNLPIRYEIYNKGIVDTETTNDLDCICCSVQSEGLLDSQKVIRGIDRGLTVRNVGATLLPLMQIRLKTAYKKATVFPLVASFISTGNDAALWTVLYNPTYNVAPAVWTSLPDSPIEYNIDNIATFTSPGTVLKSGYFSTQTRDANPIVNSSLALSIDPAGVQSVICLAVQTFSATGNYACSLGWEELL